VSGIENNRPIDYPRLKLEYGYCCNYIRDNVGSTRHIHFINAEHIATKSIMYKKEKERQPQYLEQ